MLCECKAATVLGVVRSAFHHEFAPFPITIFCLKATTAPNLVFGENPVLLFANSCIDRGFGFAMVESTRDYLESCFFESYVTPLLLDFSRMTLLNIVAVAQIDMDGCSFEFINGYCNRNTMQVADG